MIGQIGLFGIAADEGGHVGQDDVLGRLRLEHEF